MLTDSTVVERPACRERSPRRLARGLGVLGLALGAWLAFAAPGTATAGSGDDDGERFALLHEHAVLAAECARCCRRLLDAWEARAEPVTGLLPEAHDNPVWTPENSAADLFAWLVLAAEWAGDDGDRARMRHVLEAELALATRFASLPDAVHLDDLAYYHHQSRRERLVTGASEYARDGLVPIVEALGSSVWSDRLARIAGDLAATDGMPTRFGRIPAYDAEVNGELLQTLARTWHFTGDDALVPMVATIVGAYLDGVAPATGLLPCHRFDFRDERIVDASLRLHDHGNEIVPGLVEASLVLRRREPALHARLETYLHDVFRVLAERAVKPDGTFVARLDARTGAVLDESTRDSSFYLMLPFLAWSEVGGGVDHTPLVARTLAALAGGAYDTWPSPDDYADVVEAALLTMRRLPSPEAEEFVRRSTRRLLAFQRGDGFVQGGYGDGNAARTARLAGRWLRGGTELAPARDDVLLGAVIERDVLHAVLAAPSRYTGRWKFDHPRHRRWLRLPRDLPRLNEDPEWFAVEGDHWYAVTVGDGPTRMVLGATLRDGLAIDVAPNVAVRARVERLGPTPAGGHRIGVAGPGVVAADAREVRLALSHALPFTVRLRREPDADGEWIDVAPGDTVAVTVPLGEPRAVHDGVASWSTTFADQDRVLVGRWSGWALPGARALDVRVLRGDGWADGRTWVRVGSKGKSFELARGEAVEGDASLEVRFLLAGPAAALRVAFAEGAWHEVPVPASAAGWVVAAVPAELLGAGPLAVRLASLAGSEPLRVAAVALCHSGGP